MPTLSPIRPPTSITSGNAARNVTSTAPNPPSLSGTTMQPKPSRAIGAHDQQRPQNVKASRNRQMQEKQKKIESNVDSVEDNTGNNTGPTVVRSFSIAGYPRKATIRVHPSLPPIITYEKPPPKDSNVQPNLLREQQNEQETHISDSMAKTVTRAILLFHEKAITVQHLIEYGPICVLSIPEMKIQDVINRLVQDEILIELGLYEVPWPTSNSKQTKQMTVYLKLVATMADSFLEKYDLSKEAVMNALRQKPTRFTLQLHRICNDLHNVEEATDSL